MYKNGEQLLKLAQEHNQAISGAVLLAERELTGKSEEALRKELSERIAVMRGSAQGALATPRPTAGDLITGIASRHARYAEGQGTLLGGDLNRAVAQAFSSSEVNASMGKICAAPTAGSCGIVPALSSIRGNTSQKYRRRLFLTRMRMPCLCLNCLGICGWARSHGKSGNN